MTGTSVPCYACVVAKAKQKNVHKYRDKEKKGDTSRIFLDITTVMPAKDQPKPTKPVWWIMVDECTHLKFLDFYKFKNDMPEPTCE